MKRFDVLSNELETLNKAINNKYLELNFLHAKSKSAAKEIVVIFLNIAFE